jgi:MOSC domain-containing protein YiiM
VRHLTWAELETGLETIKQAPKDRGRVELIVRRPHVGAREVLEIGELSVEEGLVGDSWHKRRHPRTPDGLPHPDTQLNVMNARAIALIAQDRSRWPLAGDQLFLDMDISPENLPAGTQLQIGTAVIEVTAEPHTGCAKFVERFGVDAMKFVNSTVGRAHNLRGLNAKVVRPGTIRVGDLVSRQG